MAMETYRIRFNEYLEWATAEAGSFQQTVRMVLAYLGYDTTVRQEEFEEWLHRAPRHDCSRCGRWFEALGDAIDEEEPVLCPGCLRR